VAFKYRTSIRLHDTDAAGHLYFASYLRLAHEAFEAFLDSADIGLGYILRESDYLMPVVHVEADYKRSIFLGEPVDVLVKASHIGKTSFSISYEFSEGDGEEVAAAKIIHVVVDKESREKRPIPKELYSALQLAR
jgi:1,4-dihydroxy-2-naphthoyl-CoA hydrolase